MIDSLFNSAIEELIKRNTATHLYYVESEFYPIFKKQIKRQEIEVCVLGSLSPNEFMHKRVLVIGTTQSIDANFASLPKKGTVDFVFIPLVSITMRRKIEQNMLNYGSFSSLYINIIPCARGIKMCCNTIADMTSDFPLSALNLIKVSIANLAYISGKFSYVYGIGDFSSKLAAGIPEVLRGDGSHGLILIDREVDLLSLFEYNESYIGTLEEHLSFDAMTFTTKKSPPGLFSKDDKVFDALADKSLKDASMGIKYLDSSDSPHINILRELPKIVKSEYTLDLFRMLCNDPNCTDSYKPLLYFDQSRTLGYRLLSVMKARGKTSVAEEIAVLMMKLYPIDVFKRWCRLSKYLKPPENRLKDVISSIVTNRIDSITCAKYVSSLQKPPIGTHWSVVVINGIRPCEIVKIERFFEDRKESFNIYSNFFGSASEITRELLGLQH